MSYRHEIADHLRTTLADSGDVVASEVTVYGAGVDIIAVPCLVVNPSPVFETVVSADQASVQTNLELYLVAPRNDPASALDYLEDLRRATTTALRSMVPACRWASFGQFGTTEIGGVGYATAVLELVSVRSDA